MVAFTSTDIFDITNILARVVALELTKAWGQAVIVDNVPGAGGAFGAEKMTKATPDGCTLLDHIGTLAINPSLFLSLHPNLPYDAVKSFAPAASVARVPNVLVVHPSVKATRIKELLALAKANPGRMNYGSGGNGSVAKMATEYLKLQTGTTMLHIPCVVTPAGTPAGVVTKLNAQINQALDSRDMKTRLQSEGAIATPAMPETFGQLLVRELAPWKPVIQSGFVKADPAFEAWFGVLPDITSELRRMIEATL